MSDASVIRRIETAFGHDQGFPRPTFYAFENALRFDLGGDIEAVAPRFLQAMDRARTVARVLFAESGMLTAVVADYGGRRRTRRNTRWQGILPELGFPAPFGSYERIKKDDPDSFCYWHTADFVNEPSFIEALLWAGIASELDVTPWARWVNTIYIIDFERRLALFAYDDRGMDVIAMSREPLQPIYERFGDWLLDYDRARMDARFGPSGG